jgi:mono/diheme cytochrome c family protein
MIPPSGYLRRVFITFFVLGLPFVLGLIFTYDVIKIDWTSTMEDQMAVEYQQGPRKSAPAEAVRFDGPGLPKDGQLPANPVPADAVSLARGEQLYERNCALCHGLAGKGDGPLAAYFRKPDARKPADLTEPRLAQQSDGALYITVAQGFGQMPALRENLDVRERWDVVNYVRTFSQK